MSKLDTKNQETGVSYFYCCDQREAKSGSNSGQAKAKPRYIGTKRYAGLYCQRCERPLGFLHKKPVKLARSMRKSDKSDATIVTTCEKCGCSVNSAAKTDSIIVPCCSFDWQMPRHVLERLSRTKHAINSAAPSAKGETVSAHKDADESGITMAENSSSILRSAEFEPVPRHGHVENQYGHSMSLAEFWADVVEPCPVQMTDRVPKDYLC